MSLDLIPEDDLRAALARHRVDPEKFAAAVNERRCALESEAAANPLARLPRFAKAAAAFLPLEVLAGCRVVPAAAHSAQVGGLYKWLSYLAFPAISLFVLLGATLFSFWKVRSIQGQNKSALADRDAVQESVRVWWQQHRLAATAVFMVSLALIFVGASSLLFLFYLLSLGLVVYVLASFAKVGIGNRAVVSGTSMMGLILLGQASASAGMGSQEMHFLDQSLVSAVFFTGVLILLLYVLLHLQNYQDRQTGTLSADQPASNSLWLWIPFGVVPLVQLGLIVWIWSLDSTPTLFRISMTVFLLFCALLPGAAVLFGRWKQRHAHPRGALLQIAFVFLLLLPLMAWNARSLLWPATPARIKSYVESFHSAPYSSASWGTWEIPAQWTQDARLNPDFSQPRQLLATEIAGEQNPYILGTAMRVGLLSLAEIDQLKNYDRQRRSLLATNPGIKPQSVHLAQYDWVVRAAVLKQDLSPAERDQLEQRLLATLASLSTDEYATLEMALRASQLLSVIDRPVNRDQFRGQIHDLLRDFQHTSGGWGRINGGFKAYRNIRGGDLKATAHAVELMEIFGVPDDLDTLWLRSFLRAGSNKVLDQKWIAAATLARLDTLPGVQRPTWFDYLYSERTLLAAIALVGLCLYATYSTSAR